jgi:hypothetical protein
MLEYYFSQHKDNQHNYNQANRLKGSTLHDVIIMLNIRI